MPIVPATLGLVTAYVALPQLVEKQRETRIKDYETVLNRIYSKYETEALVEEAEIFDF